MASIAGKLSSIVSGVFEECGFPAELGTVGTSTRPDLAQFQCNGAMSAAKIAKKNPRQLAQEIVEKLQSKEDLKNVFSKIEIAGPGFLNFNVTPEYLSAHLSEIVSDERAGISIIPEKETIVLDYGGPNIAKPMHIGHLRAGIIGDALRRIFDFGGYKTYGDIHMGDWGTHLGMLFNDYIRSGETDLILGVDLDNEEDVQKLFSDLSERYPKASAAAKSDEELMKEAHEATVKMQNKEAPWYQMWEKVRAVSIIGMKKNYGALNVEFDLWKGEADVHDLIPEMVDKLKEKGYAVESEGALVVNVKRNDDNKEVPPLMLYKRDGAVMYGTTDLATIVERMDLYSPSRILYIVDQRQHLHFEQLFRASRMADITPDEIVLHHIGFGTMNGPDGKPFKTRAGGVLRLDDLIGMGEEKARQRLEEANLAEDMSDEERESVARMIAVAAIKFADLQNNPLSDYIFDFDRFTSFEGKTGPYLLYQAVRIKSLLKKAENQGGALSEKAKIIPTEQDLPLALMLSELPDAFDGSVRNYTPHILCDYVYRLAQQFSSFYNSCHILSEKDEALRTSRLTLCRQTLRQIELVLDMIGVKIPERM